MDHNSQADNSPAWRVAGAAVVGSSHQALGLPCQDHLAYRVTRTGELVVAMADGAGSAPQSAGGAQAAVACALQVLLDCLANGQPQDGAGWQDLLAQVFRGARQSILELAASQAAPGRDFATTLTCVVAGREWLAAGQVGDGVVVAASPAGELCMVAKPQRGEYANETPFLTQEDGLEQLQVFAEPCSPPALAVLSDGLARLALAWPDLRPHAPFFRPLLAFTAQASDEEQAAGQLAAFLNSERVCARTDDDKTLLLAVRAAVAAEFAGTTANGVPG